MMDAVHRYEGTVNQVLGDGIMALFGAPLAHEDHAVRACYAALHMQEAIGRYADELRRQQGLDVQIRVGLNSGEVVVRAIGNDLHMDYTAVGQTTHLAARMEQLARPGTTLLTADTLRLVEGYVEVTPLGPVPVKGLPEPVEVYELLRAGPVRSRLQAAVARGLTRFVGRDAELEHLRQALARAGAGQGQVVAGVGEAGVGKSRLLYEFTRSHHTHGWLLLASNSVSYGKATAYLPVLDLLKGYFQIEPRDDTRRRREKVTGKLLTLDRALEPTLPALLALLEVPVEDPQWQAFDPPQRRRRTLEAVKRLLLRESQVQPLCLVFEDLHWIDAETQALLDSLVESLPTARLLLLVNYRPEYQHGWGSKTYYTQLRLDPLPPASADEFLQALLGDDPSLAPLTAAPDCPHPGQSLLSGRERAHPGGDRGAGGRARRLSPGQAAGEPAGPGHGAGGAGGAHRPAAAGGEAPAPDRRGHWHGGALAAVAGHCRRARRGVAPRPGAPASRRVPLRNQPVPGARLHLQARPDARGGLRGAAAASGNACSMAGIVAAIETARCRPARPTRWNGWRTMPCGARCGTRPSPTAARRATRRWHARPVGRRWRASSRRWWPWSISPRVARATSRPSMSALACVMPSSRGSSMAASSRICARRRGSPRPWATSAG